MAGRRDDLESVLSELAKRTEALEPRPDFSGRVMAAALSSPAERGAPSDDLARLAERTEDLEPPAELTEVVMARVLGASSRGEAQALEPDAAPAVRAAGSGFVQKTARASGLADNLAKSGLRAMAVLAAVAAACILFSTYAERSVETRLISNLYSSDAVEGGE